MSQTAFSSVKLNTHLLQNLNSLGYLEMTAIQALSLPPILAGKDIVAQGKTGSGKTAAFGLALLEKLDVKQFYVQALVLCPTRELADQVANEIRKLARASRNTKVLTLCGGMPFGPQVGSLEHGAHIVVGTPGRVDEHLRKGKLDLARLTTLVLDEADRMLDMGFQEVLDSIVEQTPKDRQTLLFSATFPDEILSIVDRITRQPEMVKVDSRHEEAVIEQHFFNIDHAGDGGAIPDARMTALRLLLMKYRPQSTLVFCNTKRDTQAVANDLCDFGFHALAIHGDLEQKDRDHTLVRFSNKSVSILVATDVAARGLDIDELDAVINYHIARDLEVHVHRIGRTGRAGNKGIACSLYGEKERYKVGLLGDYLSRDIVSETLPSLDILDRPAFKSTMATLQIDGGKKRKIRPGDILGALTAGDGIEGKDVGKIHIFNTTAFVAVHREVAGAALKKLRDGKLKGRSFRVRRI